MLRRSMHTAGHAPTCVPTCSFKVTVASDPNHGRRKGSATCSGGGSLLDVWHGRGRLYRRGLDPAGLRRPSLSLPVLLPAKLQFTRRKQGLSCPATPHLTAPGIRIVDSLVEIAGRSEVSLRLARIELIVLRRRRWRNGEGLEHKDYNLSLILATTGPEAL